MLGIVLISHGELARGMARSAAMFYGDEIPQMKYACLQFNQSPDDFKELLEKAINEVDTGDGVVVFTDLFGGTPANQAGAFLERAEIITGMNFPMLVELLGLRMSGNDVDIPALIQAGRDGIKRLNRMSAKYTDNLF